MIIKLASVLASIALLVAFVVWRILKEERALLQRHMRSFDEMFPGECYYCMFYEHGRSHGFHGDATPAHEPCKRRTP